MTPELAKSIAEREARVAAYEAQKAAERAKIEQFEKDSLEYAKNHLHTIPSHSKSNFEYGMKLWEQGKVSWVNKFGYQLVGKIEAGLAGWKRASGLDLSYYLETEAGTLRLFVPNYKSEPYRMSYSPCNNLVEAGLMAEKPELYKVD